MSADRKDVAPVATDDINGRRASAEETNQELGRKVFVGNLNFVTKEAQLRELFGKCGEITDIQIILRGSRSLGYGFVTFAAHEDAEKAVVATDKSEIDGRIINVEIAKPTPGTPGGPPRARRVPRPPKAHRSPSKVNGESKAADHEEQDNQTDNHITAGGPKPRRPKGRGRRFVRGKPRKPKEETNGEDHGATTDTSVHNEENSPKKTSPKSGRNRSVRRSPRGEGRRTGPPSGEPSKTLLFVANLSFGLTDEQLKDFFSAYNVISAHVVRRKFRWPSHKRSKGFGFVEFDCEESQLRALAETQGKELDGRPLHVKVAVSSGRRSAEEPNGDGQSGSDVETAQNNHTAAEAVAA
ncbi:hypothetical protein O181_059451 [Austropuccinia psidii MF-1]|uniref:RRM domain-containing protein n=1 Tax=Austropuccinia psidii MF-1 TaxID=1389203 RepID=A0A9Q3EC84_9BASI|nr:hypothetical protein [Austropuccinia psidii MF-1]